MTTKPYSIPELANMWEREQISAEQMLGQLLAHISLLQAQILGLQKAPQPPINDTRTAQSPNPPKTA